VDTKGSGCLVFYNRLVGFTRVWPHFGVSQKCITIHIKTIRQPDVCKTQSLLFFRVPDWMLICSLGGHVVLYLS